jgi:hypothetical protein
MVDLFRSLYRHYYLTHPEAAASSVNRYRALWTRKNQVKQVNNLNYLPCLCAWLCFFLQYRLKSANIVEEWCKVFV